MLRARRAETIGLSTLRNRQKGLQFFSPGYFFLDEKTGPRAKRVDMKSRDAGSSLVLMIIGLSFIAGGLRMGLGPLNAPGAGFFPVTIGGLFSLLSGALFVKSFLAGGPDREKTGFWREERSWVRVSLSLLSLVFYLIALNYLGYIFTTALFILFLLKVVGKKGWKISLFMAVIVSLSSYALFRMGLGVSLPKGWISL